MDNSDRWSILFARMTRLGTLLDQLTAKAMMLVMADPASIQSRTLQYEMTELRVQARQLVKSLKCQVQEAKQGA